MKYYIMMFGLILTGFYSFGQNLPLEMRKKFVTDQNAYFDRMTLNLEQNKQYKLVTIKYDKMFILLDNSDNSKGFKKKTKNKLLKSKNKEMKRILKDWQYKMYQNRQEEISKNYKKK